MTRTLAPRARALAVAAPLALCLALPAAARADDGPGPGWQHGAFMEVFVRGYRDSDGDGTGDLKGLAQSLDYLQQLGIRGLWLMPITKSEDHDHGYAVVDFRRLEPAYGSLKDLDVLVKKAHERGIGIIVDYVLNHSSAASPMFQEAKASPKSPWRDWYVWRDPAPQGWDVWGKNPWYPTEHGSFYATFGPHMPDFNLRNSETVRYHFDSLRLWLDRGIDGFRFDAVPHLIENSAKEWNDQPESRALMAEVRKLVQSYPNRHIVCEATASPEVWASPEVCGSAFAFGFERHVAPAARGEPEAIHAVADWFATHPLTMATMVSNHDIFAGQRLWDQVHGDIAQYKLAAATYLLMPGTPFIYYGEEVGMSGGRGLQGDPSLRTPMSWTADEATAGFTRGKPFRATAANVAQQNVQAEQSRPDSILAFYKAMLGLRNSLPSISQGSYEKPFVQGRLMGYQRRFEKELTLVLVNYDAAEAQATVEGLPEGAEFKAMWPAADPSLAAGPDGRARVSVPARSLRVYTFHP